MAKKHIKSYCVVFNRKSLLTKYFGFCAPNCKWSQEEENSWWWALSYLILEANEKVVINHVTNQGKVVWHLNINILYVDVDPVSTPNHYIK